MVDLGEILSGIISPDNGNFPADLAHYVLRMRFTDVQASRYQDLADRNQLGQLSPEERNELEAYVMANSFLMILKSKARRSLITQPSVA